MLLPVSRNLLQWRRRITTPNGALLYQLSRRIHASSITEPMYVCFDWRPWCDFLVPAGFRVESENAENGQSFVDVFASAFPFLSRKISLNQMQVSFCCEGFTQINPPSCVLTTHPPSSFILVVTCSSTRVFCGVVQYFRNYPILVYFVIRELNSAN